MDKKELIATYGQSKVKKIAGILHNYTPNGTLSEAEQLEHIISYYGDVQLSEALPFMEDFLELN